MNNLEDKISCPIQYLADDGHVSFGQSINHGDYY